MKLIKWTPAILLLFLIFGCSNTSTSPLTPQSENDTLIPLSSKINTEHQLLGGFTASFDIETFDVTIESDRSLDAHLNVTSMIPPPFIVLNNWDPMNEIIDVDVTVSNPFLGFDAYDVRLIIYTDDTGHKLLNGDASTSLWDIPGGDDTNPFIAYAKIEPNRIFVGPSSNIENLLIKCPGADFTVQFAIDASFPGNCNEPYNINNFQQNELYDAISSTATVTVDVLAWQNDTSLVNLTCGEIAGPGSFPFTFDTGNTWTLELINQTGAPVGDYTGYINATTSSSDPLALYDEVTISVTPWVPGYLWTKTWGGGSADGGTSITIDDLGNTYVAGYFASWVDFNPDGGGRQTSHGGDDAFLSKFDSSGIWQWTKIWGGTGYDWANSVAFDQNGGIYVTGRFEGTVDFDPLGGGTLSSNGGADVYLSQFDTSGNWQWTKTWGGTGKDYSFSVAADISGSVCVTGYFNGTVDFNPDGGGTQTSNGREDVFVSKFDSSGAWQWSKTWGSTSQDEANSVTLDQTGNIFVIGFYQKTVDFNPDGGGTHISNGSADVFLSLFDQAGVWQWTKTWGGGSWDEGTYLSCDQNGDVFTLGTYQLTVDLNPDGGATNISKGRTDVFLSKFDSLGLWQWSIVWGGGDWDYGYGMALDQSDNISVAGTFSSTVDFNPDGGGTHTSNGWGDMYFSKFDSDGNWQKTKTFGGLHQDNAFSICLSQAGETYLTGYYISTIDFNPDGGDPHTNNGSSDAYLWKGHY